jgi:hypothetical protein
MSSSSESSRLIPRGSQGSDFQQQGTVDWGNISKSTVSFTVDALNRYSKAGVEVITVLGARAIFSQAKLSVIGEERIQNALDKTQAFPTLNKALWLGFGTKHIVHSLREHHEGLACIGICAALVEMYSTSFSARVLQELFQLYNPPADFTPALRQWVALVEACAGVLAPTEFGLILHQILSKVFLNPDRQNLRSFPSALSVATTLKALLDVSNGALDRLLLTGGSDCAWIAAVSHWILGLSTEIQDEHANIMYRPGVQATVNPSPRTQVIVVYDKGSSGDRIELLSRCYAIPSGRDLIYEIGADFLSHGRVSWNTCLVDTFGRSMSRLLTPLAPITGICIGTGAKILANVRGGDHLEFADAATNVNFQHLPLNSATSFRGFVMVARNLLPELNGAPQLIQAIEEAAGLSFKDAVQEHRVAMSFLEAQCACRDCCQRRNAAMELGKADNATDPGAYYCLLRLVHVIGNLVRTVASCSLPKTQTILPTRSGIELMYKDICGPGGASGIDYDKYLLEELSPLPHVSTILTAQQLFTGTRPHRSSLLANLDREVDSAVAEDGFCFYLGTLCEITADPTRAGIVNITPGTIQWNGFHYSHVIDAKAYHDAFAGSSQYYAEKQTVVDDLSSRSLPGSASDKLEAKLLVQESSDKDRANHLTAAYAVSRRGDGRNCFFVGPADISRKLQKASRIPTKSCYQPSKCGSADGVSALLVEGEGLLDLTLNPPKGSPEVRALPFIRVIADQDLAVWIALMQESATGNNRSPGGIGYIDLQNFLQGDECLYCCVTAAIRLTPDNQCPVCIVKPT